jgi:hypothetical protein
MHDDGDQFPYCHAHMLPNWERRTDGNPAMRRLIECNSADPHSYNELFTRLVNTAAEIRLQGDVSSVRAALAAADGCCQAYVGVPQERFIAACSRAEAHDRVAHGRRILVGLESHIPGAARQHFPRQPNRRRARRQRRQRRQWSRPGSRARWPRLYSLPLRL